MTDQVWRDALEPIRLAESHEIVQDFHLLFHRGVVALGRLLGGGKAPAHYLEFLCNAGDNDIKFAKLAMLANL